ncbi:MAG: hypothetical protein AAB759_01445 [Patescibacteria group bacterium]
MRATVSPLALGPETIRLAIANELLDRLELLRAEFLKVPHWRLPFQPRNDRIQRLRQKYKDLVREARELVPRVEGCQADRIDACLVRLNEAFAIAQGFVTRLEKLEDQ